MFIWGVSNPISYSLNIVCWHKYFYINKALHLFLVVNGQMTISPQPTAVVRQNDVLNITCQLTNQRAIGDISFLMVSTTQGVSDRVIASPYESFGTCSNSTADGTQPGYYLVCEFGTNTAHLLIENPVQGDEYYCRRGISRSPRTRVSVAGNNLLGYIMSLPSVLNHTKSVVLHNFLCSDLTYLEGI